MIRLTKTLILFLILTSLNLFGQDYERYKKLIDTTISSKYLGFDKNITITVPFEWQKDLNRDFPVIIVFDRQNQRSHNYILNTIDYLTSNEQMPSAIIISVESEQRYRLLETLHKTSNEKGLLEENEKFIFDELLPFAENQYKASPFRLFIGHSRYGYFTTSLLFSKANELSGVISLSPFFTQKNVSLVDSIGTLENQQFSSNKYYSFGIGNDYPDDFVKMDSVVKQFKNPRLNTKGLLFKEAEHNVTPGLAIGASLYEIFEDWSRVQSKYFSNGEKQLTIINSLEEEITDNYGSELAFSLGTLNGKGWYFYGEQEYEKAIEAWKIMLESYPNFSEGYLYIVEAQIQLKEDTSDTKENFIQSLTNSDIYSENEKSELKKELDSLNK